ncbi:hypothetical protein [Aliarcobacter cryaerophilus]|jgi:hypothetical protein|uniref:hypothetical protein n=1 Tax=Aliarcobacter cryaerophilus TaxID=28198 RepID=UPI00112F03B9|nr:hypothetical protein [Aliarcobacter cryaerophilus]
MKKIVLGLLFMMSFSFATTEGAKELVNFLGFTGVSVSLDLAVFVTIILTLITWKITKDKEQNEIKEKYKDSARKSLLEYLGKLRDITKKLIDFKNQYTSVSDKLSDEEKMKLQLQNAHLISEYQKNLNEFLFISPIYSKKLYEILKDSMDHFEFAQKNGSIEIVVFSSVKTMGKLLVEYTEEEIANDLTKSIYGLTIEEAEKKLQEFKNHFERK